MSEERKITKEYLLEHLNENEMDLGMTNLSRVPVRELVSRLSPSPAKRRTARHSSLLLRRPRYLG